MTTQMRLRQLGLSRREAKAMIHAAEMYGKEMHRECDRECPGWRKKAREAKDDG